MLNKVCRSILRATHVPQMLQAVDDAIADFDDPEFKSDLARIDAWTIRQKARRA